MVAVAIALGVWIASGTRVLDPAREFGVLEGPRRGETRALLNRRIVVAPPGPFRLSIFPRTTASVPLPGAGRAMLQGAEGSRFGLKGSVSLRALPERAADLVRAAGGDGIEGVVLAAVRAAGPAISDAPQGERAVSTRVDAFRRALLDALTARGVVVEALSLEGLDYLASTSDTAPVPPDARVLIVGLDGADWEIVDPLMAAGRMPNLAALVARGVRAKFLSITPTLSPVVWTSIATGVEPTRHGILDFLTTRADGTSEPVTSRSRAVPALWDILSGAGVHVAVTGWWATWPADRVLGTMVTDRLAYQLFGFQSDARSAEGKTWPPELYDTVRHAIVSPEEVTWEDVRPYLDGPRTTPEAFDPDETKLLDDFRTLLASGRTYLAAALAQRGNADLRFEAVYFEGTDTVGHLFMPYRAPRLPEIDPRRFASFHAVVDRTYEAADAMLGKLLADRDDWTVIVLSDHGFASDATRPRTTDSRIGHGAAADWHRRFGILVMAGPGVRRGVRLEEASVYDVAPTVLALFNQPVPRSWPGHVLGPALTPALLASRQVRFRVDDPVRAGGAASTTGPSDSGEAAELREKLQSLGYVSAAPQTPMTTDNNRGVSLLAAERFDEAAAEFRRAIAEAPDQPTLWVNLGIALRFGGKSAEARAAFQRALGSPQGFRAAGHQLAQLDLEANDLAGAERQLRAVLTREPGAAEVRNSLGLVLERRGDVAAAEREYAAASKLDPNAAEPRNNLGNLAKLAGRMTPAERFYQEAIAADPYFMGSYNNLALLYQERGENGKAIDLYGRALSKAPKNAVVNNNLASLYFSAGDNAQASALWRKAVELDPSYPSPLNNLAGLALSEGRLDDAEALLARALALDASYGDARINRAMLLERRGNREGARAELNLACRDPRSAVAARIQLGLLELRAGRPRAAVDAFQGLRGGAGDRTDVHNPLGEAYARLGERARAAGEWKRSLQIDPRQERIVEALNKLEKHN
jgi:Tfp pilus assembly protein PilF/predicted AlkP superfamily phosphohydrolase/phosphomutase